MAKYAQIFFTQSVCCMTGSFVHCTHDITILLLLYILCKKKNSKSSRDGPPTTDLYVCAKGQQSIGIGPRNASVTWMSRSTQLNVWCLVLKITRYFPCIPSPHWDKKQLLIQKLPRIWCLKNVNFVNNELLKMWILWKMRLWICEFCGKWDIENVNFVKNEIMKLWIL